MSKKKKLTFQVSHEKYFLRVLCCAEKIFSSLFEKGSRLKAGLQRDTSRILIVLIKMQSVGETQQPGCGLYCVLLVEDNGCPSLRGPGLTAAFPRLARNIRCFLTPLPLSHHLLSFAFQVKDLIKKKKKSFQKLCAPNQLKG